VFTVVWPWFDEDVEKRRVVFDVAAVNFPKRSLHSVTLYGVPDPFGNDNAEPVVPEAVLSVNQDKARTLPPPPLFEQPGYLAPLLDLPSPAEPQSRSSGLTYSESDTVRRLRPLARRALSTLRPLAVAILALNPCLLALLRLEG